MWIISKTGKFLSAVQHNTDAGLIRVRARRYNDLAAAFPARTDAIIDMKAQGGEYDYQFAINVPRTVWSEYLVAESTGITYTGHVKESVSGPSDPELYSAMLSIWSTLYELQEPKQPFLGSSMTFDWDDEFDDDDKEIPGQYSLYDFGEDEPDHYATLPANPLANAARNVANELADVVKIPDNRGNLTVCIDPDDKNSPATMMTVNVDDDQDLDDPDFEDVDLPALVQAAGYDADKILDWDWTNNFDAE